MWGPITNRDGGRGRESHRTTETRLDTHTSHGPRESSVRHPARAGSMSFNTPPFAFSRATTPWHISRALQPANRTRRVAQAMRRQWLLPHRPLVTPGPSTSAVSTLSHFVRALRIMYAACPGPQAHAIQLPEVAANAPRQHQVLSPLHQRAVLRPRDHDKRSRGTIGSCVRALAEV
jgi:hypothetical protein